MQNTLALLLVAPLLPQDEAETFPVTLATDASIELESFWQPVEEWSLGTQVVVENPVLRGVAPAEATRTVGAEVLAPFLPPAPVAVGAPWTVDRDAVVPLLTQFHPGATSKLAHEPQAVPGSHALLRAVSAEHAELLTRSHASFALSELVHLNPAQYEGRLLVDRRSGAIVAYRLHLPSRKTNVDASVATQESLGNPFQGPRIDLGWVPRMELVGGEWPADMEWEHEVDLETARRTLRERYYGAVDWLPFEAAVERAGKDGRPLHVVAVFGTLDDESC